MDPTKDDPDEERQFQARMAHWQARWEAGDLDAVSRAVRELVRHRSAPVWLDSAVRDLVVMATPEEEMRQRRDWHNHRARWEALAELRARRHELFEQLGDDRGTSWERAREAVSDVLRGTEAAGSARTIKASFELVEAAGGEHATFASYKALLHRRVEK
jgi:hypothetical protein